MNPGRDSKGLEKTRKRSVKGHEGTLRFLTNAHSIIEPVSFLSSSLSSCLSCVSMFNG